MGSIPGLIFMRKIKKAKDNSLKNKILIDWEKNSYKKLLIIPNISMFLIIIGNFSQFIKNERAFFISDQDIFLIITNFIVLYLIGYVSLRLALIILKKG